MVELTVYVSVVQTDGKKAARTVAWMGKYLVESLADKMVVSWVQKLAAWKADMTVAQKDHRMVEMLAGQLV